jgi:hypothetical protein
MTKFFVPVPGFVIWESNGDPELEIFLKAIAKKYPRQLSRDPDVQTRLDEERLATTMDEIDTFLYEQNKMTTARFTRKIKRW